MYLFILGACFGIALAGIWFASVRLWTYPEFIPYLGALFVGYVTALMFVCLALVHTGRCDSLVSCLF
jgi:hypothetical protein